jgi:hypothetical protein
MSSPPFPDLDALSADELKRLVVQLLGRVSALEEENRQLREERARLKDLPKRPRLAPGGMDKASGPDRPAKARRRGRGRGGRRTPPVTEEHTLTVAAPPGSRRKGGACPRAGQGRTRGSPTRSKTSCCRPGSSATGGSGG